MELEGASCVVSTTGSGYAQSSLSYMEHFKIHHRFAGEKTLGK